MAWFLSLALACVLAVALIVDAAWFPAAADGVRAAPASAARKVVVAPEAQPENGSERRTDDALAKLEQAVRTFGAVPPEARGYAYQTLRGTLRDARHSAPTLEVTERITAIEKTIDSASYDAISSDIVRERSESKRGRLERKRDKVVMRAAGRARAPFPLR